VLVLAGSRFRDETERQRAIDRLSPKPPGAPADDASDPPPRLTREPSSRASRPRRFRDAYRESSGGLRGVRGVPGEDDDDDDGPDPRELARRRRAERAESESADRLEYLVAVIRRELGRPQALLAADADVKARRFDALSSALKNFGFVEVMFGLVKYYYAHWDEPPEGFESAAATRAEDERESSAAGRDGESDESTSAASAADALEDGARGGGRGGGDAAHPRGARGRGGGRGRRGAGRRGGSIGRRLGRENAPEAPPRGAVEGHGGGAGRIGG
jgi:hypothetical protein